MKTLSKGNYYSHCLKKQKAHEMILNIMNYYSHENQNYKEVSPRSSHNGHFQNIYKQ